MHLDRADVIWFVIGLSFGGLLMTVMAFCPAWVE